MILWIPARRTILRKKLTFRKISSFVVLRTPYGVLRRMELWAGGIELPKLVITKKQTLT
jgi:hypothetical protein